MKRKYKGIISICISALLVVVYLYYAKMPQVEDRGEWVKLHKSHKINGYLRVDDKIYGGDFGISDIKYATPLKDVDPESFEVCKNSDYARDKNHVYYPIWVKCYDGETWGICEYVEYIVKGASPKSFKYIGKEYGVDGYTMYYRGEKTKWNDSLLVLMEKRD